MSATLLTRFRVAILIISGLGVVVFASILALVQFAPDDLETRARDFALESVEARIENRLQDENTDRVLAGAQDIAGRFSDRLEGRVASVRAAIDEGLPELIADIIANACEFDCQRRAELTQNARAFFDSYMARYGIALETFRDIVEGEYEEIVEAIKADLTIFSACNLVLLLFIALLAMYRGSASAHLVPFAGLVLFSTFAAASWYLFGQDWFLTILFNNYWGYGYTILLGTIVIFLVDIAFFKAVMTTVVLNTVGAGLFRLSPC
jgi:hypothetical protein